MDYDERDAGDVPESDRPDDSAAEPMSDEAPQPPAEGPAGEPEPQAPAGAPDESAPAEPDVSAASEPPVEEPAAAEIESWPSQDAASADEPVQPAASESPAWPTEAPEAGEAEEGTWPTSAPERGDEVEAATSEPEWPPEETAAAAGAGAAAAVPAEAEAETPTDDSAWPVAGAAAGAAAAGTAPAADVVPPPEEAEAYPAADVAAVAAAGAAAHGVPDAEAAVGESTQCPRCGTENPPGLAFCRNCGQRLVAAGVSTTVERPGTPEGSVACPRCGTHNRAGVAFCQNCGANLRGTAPGYVPPAVAGEAAAATAAVERRGAVLGPVVLLIGMVGLITGYLLPFAYGERLAVRPCLRAGRLRDRLLERLSLRQLPGRHDLLRPRRTRADPRGPPRDPGRRRLHASATGDAAGAGARGRARLERGPDRPLPGRRGDRQLER